MCNLHNSYDSFCSALFCCSFHQILRSIRPTFQQPKLHLIAINSKLAMLF
ncbi:hypothetical protein BofuT4_uP013910.1 [Botrytis cinerea T4]|uniref:Uncharacterized protein n=1 Tax=Botryotinia fuckeliana (strain T4) TaxID=999810 RepID=G2XN07_BOTF4|nr:hypothetical protein BofuT4_uP013910.1 [Botrytis cinerea T4]